MKSNNDLVEVLVHDAMSKSATDTTNVHLRSHIAQLHPVIVAATLTEMHKAVAEANTQLDEVHLTRLIDLIRSGKSSSYDLPGGVMFSTDHMHIRMEAPNSVSSDVVPYPQPLSSTTELAVPGELDLGNGFTITASFIPRSAGVPIASSDEAWLSSEIASNNRLEVRNRRPSDRFNPLGMNQDVDLSDFLIKAKVAASWRDRIPLVTLTDNGRIVWLPGLRPAEWAKLSPAHQTALHLKIERDHSRELSVNDIGTSVELALQHTVVVNPSGRHPARCDGFAIDLFDCRNHWNWMRSCDVPTDYVQPYFCI